MDRGTDRLVDGSCTSCRPTDAWRIGGWGGVGEVWAVLNYCPVHLSRWTTLVTATNERKQSPDVTVSGQSTNNGTFDSVRRLHAVGQTDIKHIQLKHLAQGHCHHCIEFRCSLPARGRKFIPARGRKHLNSIH